MRERTSLGRRRPGVSKWVCATAVIEVGRLILDMSTKRWRETMNRKLEVIKGNTVTQMAQPYNLIHEGISMFKMPAQKNSLAAKNIVTL